MKESHRKPIEEALGYLTMKGWSFTKICPLDTHTIPFKQKLVCLRKPKLKKEPTIDQVYYCYEPEVLDLSKIEIKIELLVSKRVFATGLIVVGFL